MLSETTRFFTALRMFDFLRFGNSNEYLNAVERSRLKLGVCISYVMEFLGGLTSTTSIFFNFLEGFFEGSV